MRKVRSRGQRAGLTREAVVAAARACVERDGVEALSMRRLAAELGVHANALYSYVRTKDELLDAIVDELLGDVPLPAGPPDDPRAALFDVFRGSRRLLQRHPRLVSLVVARPKRGPNADRLTAAMDALFPAAGLDRRLLGPMLIYLFGFAAMEAARGDGGGPSDEDFENGLAWLVRGAG
jgi:AcrR family transcriptional regulator